MIKRVSQVGCIVVLLFMSFGHTAFAQDYEFKKVSKEELSMSVYPQDTAAPAVYLHKSRNTYYEDDEVKGWVLYTDVHERIKILNKDGLDYATRKINLYIKGRLKERVESIKAYTYNLENGKVKSEKLSKSGIFENMETDNRKEVSLTMPAVKVGSVLEISYRIVSPFFTTIDDVVIQEDIPTAHHYTKIQILEYFQFSRLIKGNFNANPKDYTDTRRIDFTYEQGGGLTSTTKDAAAIFKEFISEYEYMHVPALKEERYVDNIDNYRYTVVYELSSTKSQSGVVKEYSRSWEDVVATIYKYDGFGKQLERTNFFKDDLAGILEGSSGYMDRMNRVFDYVKSHMNWDKRYGLSAANGIAKAYREKTGNTGDINLLLTAMLKEAGLNANPVLVSTRSHGIPAYPTIDGFNYVIAAVEIDGQRYLLDATEKMAAPNVLPNRVLNWSGTMVMENGLSMSVDLYPKTISQVSTMLNVELDDFGDISGSVRANRTLLEALDQRRAFENESPSKIEEDLMDDYNLDLVSDLELKNLNDTSKPVSMSYSFEKEGAVEIIDGDIYLNPMFFLGMYENPFKLDERNYPINFVHPYMHRKIINITLPEGYTVTNVPEALNISLPDGLGAYTFNIGQSNGKLNVVCSITMKQAVVPSMYYETLKEFYGQRVAKESERVIISKS
ncbi:DUF3857 domain-containing protein [Gilvibacter sediminis]|uniref:DUF3857 domain-containing protein n=1 Tax=Gilvibacter sediminis TaxID=379071 RepID=UPI00234FDEF0|nr:DUF3857 domain-containing protein [Gilvibacter sediminis]MDC7998673.1 DUF3857 domain-containing protein [Gilvibacter sediminis]